MVTPPKPLRLRPGVIIAALLLAVRFALPAVWPDASAAAMLGGLAATLALLIWWLFFSRAAWIERIGVLVAAVAAALVVRPCVDKSILGGMMGMMYPVYALPPVLGLALVIWAVATRHLSTTVRRVSLVIVFLLACGVWTLLRTDGIKGAGAQLAWRWTKTPEERLLAQADDDPKPPPAAAVPALPAAAPAPVAEASSPKPSSSSTPASPVSEPARPPVPTRPAEWPGFRGRNRDGVIHGMQIATDWSASPPVQMWRRPVGPGWSSFAVSGDLLYTQEQRGGDEVVACYRVSTGQPIWRHRDQVRFWESNGGAGPRGTPTLSGGRVYAFGATGLLNTLDAISGAVIWSKNVAADTGTKVPMWGFASSPLVVGDLVIVAASGKLAAYDTTTAERRWLVPSSGGSYSSPQLMNVDGVQQVVLLSGGGAKSVAPATGAVLWESTWPGSVTIVQPAIVGDRDVLFSTTAATGGLGMRRVALAHDARGWRAEERWTSTGLKPYYNDSVVHNGFAYGFDGTILSCIDLADGTRKWKGGRYGGGQLVLLADQDLLLVVSEDGDLALVKAAPDQFTEVTRVRALDGKTWNHPVVVRDVLLVRNDQEMAAFRLPAAR